MENNRGEFYSNRVLTGLIGIVLLGMLYIVYTQLLEDPYGLTSTAVVVMWVVSVLLLVFGIGSLIKAIDPRPVVIINSEGLKIRTFVLFEEFVSWEEVKGVNQQRYKSQVVSLYGFARVTTNILRIYRPQKRSIAINLTLLNKRGKQFHETLSYYLNSKEKEVIGK